VAYNRARVQEGVAAEADLIRSQLERDRVAADASLQQAELAQARAALGAYLGDARASVAVPAVAIEDMPLPMPGGAGTIDTRPEVRAARARLAAAGAAVGVERSMIVRQVGATIGTMQTGRTTSMIAGIALPLPLFDQNRGEIQRATSERD